MNNFTFIKDDELEELNLFDDYIYGTFCNGNRCSECRFWQNGKCITHALTELLVRTAYMKSHHEELQEMFNDEI